MRVLAQAKREGERERETVIECGEEYLGKCGAANRLQIKASIKPPPAGHSNKKVEPATIHDLHYRPRSGSDLAETKHRWWSRAQTRGATQRGSSSASLSLSLSIGTCALFSFYFRFIICRRRFALMPFTQPNRLLSRRCSCCCCLSLGPARLRYW